MTTNNTPVPQLPVHPYSLKAMRDAIEEAAVYGEARYNNPDDNLPTLAIYQDEKTQQLLVEVSGNATLDKYTAFKFDNWEPDLPTIYNDEILPDLYEKKFAPLLEFCCNELFYQEFSVKEKKTGKDSKAFYFEAAGKFFIEESLEFVDSISELDQRFHVYVPEPTLTDLHADGGAMTDDTFWDMVEKCQWKKDGDYERISKFLSENYDVQTLIKFDTKMSEMASKLYKHSDNHPEAFEDVYRGGDGFSDCVYHIIGSGKVAFDKCMKEPEFFAKFANSGKYVESFSYTKSYHSQLNIYPYPVQLSDKSNAHFKAFATMYLEKLKAIDFDEIIPKLHEETRAKQDQAIYRMQKLLEGNFREAYQDFDYDKYSSLCDIGGTDLHAGPANLVSDAMKLDGFNFKTVQWVNGEPRNPAPKGRQLENNQQSSLEA